MYSIAPLLVYFFSTNVWQFSVASQPAFTDNVGDYEKFRESPAGHENLVFATHTNGVKCILKNSFFHQIAIKDEVEILKTLAVRPQYPSPFIPQLYRNFRKNMKQYEVLEFVSGTDLTHLVTKGTLKTEKRKEYIAQMAMALKDVHTHQIVHNDIKTDNFIVSENDRVVLIDFGVSQKLKKHADLIRHFIGGAILYMAPEKINFIIDGYNHISDFYSFGITIYVMYCNVPS